MYLILICVYLIIIQLSLKCNRNFNVGQNSIYNRRRKWVKLCNVYGHQRNRADSKQPQLKHSKPIFSYTADRDYKYEFSYYCFVWEQFPLRILLPKLKIYGYSLLRSYGYWDNLKSAGKQSDGITPCSQPLRVEKHVLINFLYFYCL